MATRLYLDTARLGLMSLSAQLAHRDFARFAGEEGLSLYWDRFLHNGFEALPPSLQQRHRGLDTWRGVSELKTAFQRLVGLREDVPVFLAGRSTQAMRLGMRLLFRKARRVLTTDLSWPAYRRLLRREAHRAAAELICLRLRKYVVRDRINSTELSEKIRELIAVKRCDGIFLPAVTHDGIRVPFQDILTSLRRRGTLRFSVIDGAQHFCHVADEESVRTCDFYVTGTHKWLGSTLPLGIATMPCSTDSPSLALEATDIIERRQVDDPLMSFTIDGKRDRFSETVNLVPLLTCRAAIHDQAPHASERLDVFRRKRLNVSRLATIAADSGWRPILPHETLQSGIALLQSCSPHSRTLDQHPVREHFANLGIALTSYARGRIRIASPSQLCGPAEIRMMGEALRNFAPTCAREAQQTEQSGVLRR